MDVWIMENLPTIATGILGLISGWLAIRSKRQDVLIKDADTRIIDAETKATNAETALEDIRGKYDVDKLQLTNQLKESDNNAKIQELLIGTIAKLSASLDNMNSGYADNTTQVKVSVDKIVNMDDNVTAASLNMNRVAGIAEELKIEFALVADRLDRIEEIAADNQETKIMRVDKIISDAGNLLNKLGMVFASSAIEEKPNGDLTASADNQSEKQSVEEIKTNEKPD